MSLTGWQEVVFDITFSPDYIGSLQNQYAEFFGFVLARLLLPRSTNRYEVRFIGSTIVRAIVEYEGDLHTRMDVVGIIRDAYRAVGDWRETTGLTM